LSFAPAAHVWRAVALAFALAGAVAIAGTYGAFSNTSDEPAHLAAGVEWLTKGQYRIDVAHPPLGRVAAALGPFLKGAHSLGAATPTDEGLLLLGSGTHYRATLALARFGELPFFLLLCGIVWAWGRRMTDERGGALAVLLMASNPNVLAHAALATPDIALAATVSAALFAFICWLDEPGPIAALPLGVSLGLAATSDFSSLPYLSLACAAIYLVRRSATDRAPIWTDNVTWRRTLSVTLVVASALLAGWAVYRFDVGPITPGSRFPFPAPAWFRGIGAYLTTPSPDPGFLFGELSAGGWWYYYPVALLVKTPLPLLALAIVGAAVSIGSLVRRDDWRGVAPLCAIIAVLVVAAVAADDSGIRVVLPVFPLLAVAGSVGAVELWERGANAAPARRLARIMVTVTLIAAVLVPMRAQPDHLAYFNPIAGDAPGRILVDSNLDWGQDLYRLGSVMKRLHIDSIRVAYFGSAPLEAAGVRRARFLEPDDRPRGWIAASESMIAGVGGDGAYEWLGELRPMGRVGASLVLFYVPPPPRPSLTSIMRLTTVRSRSIR
jgi:hypothetical protein